MAFLPFPTFPALALRLPCFKAKKTLFQITDGQGDPRRCNNRVVLFFFSGLPPLLSSLSCSNQGPRSRQGDGNHTCERGHQFVKTVEKLGAELNPCFHDPPTPMHQRSKTYLNNISWISGMEKVRVAILSESTTSRRATPLKVIGTRLGLTAHFLNHALHHVAW